MKLARSIDELRNAVAVLPRPLGCVPTMGALHEGHLSLIRTARARCDSVAVSIFVNPLQFGPTEDLSRYPRNEETDVAAAEDEKADIVFLPSVDEMYPDGSSTTVSTGDLGTLFEGDVRPGHFDGVATVVAKLFAIVQPDIAIFGQKDAQQLAVIRRMVADLSFPVEIVAGETVREPDGLAMSSRNVYLSPDERTRATALWQALNEGADALRRNGAAAAHEAMRGVLGERVDSVDYAAVVDPDTFGDPVRGRPHLLIVAARLGGTRLIDNLLVEIDQ